MQPVRYGWLYYVAPVIGIGYVLTAILLTIIAFSYHDERFYLGAAACVICACLFLAIRPLEDRAWSKYQTAWARARDCGIDPFVDIIVVEDLVQNGRVVLNAPNQVQGREEM